MTLEVYFTADDFGLDAQVNQAVVHTHRHGALRGASLMMGQPGTTDAVAQARENPGLQIGWHLHLCDSRPVTCQEWPWGNSPSRAGWEIFFSPSARKLMEREVQAQWEMFQATGLACSFVNTHHHLHLHPSVYACLVGTLPRDFEGWIRLGRPRYFSKKIRTAGAEAVTGWVERRRRARSSWRFSDGIWGMDRTFRMSSQEIAGALRSRSELTGLQEFIFHPRRSKEDHDAAALVELRTMGF